MRTLNSKEINQYQYLFLGGVLGEILVFPFVANYLRENKRIMAEFGVDENSIHVTTLER